MPYHYKVWWQQNETCNACGFKHKELYTYGFLNPEKAMEQALWVLKQGYTLILLEQ